MRTTLYANPDKNIVKFDDRTTKYFRHISGKRCYFNTSFRTKSEAREHIKLRRKLTGYNDRMIKIGSRYLVYTCGRR